MVKNLQNKKFCIKLNHKCYREILENSEHDYLFFYYLLHMKMKKMLIGAFLGMFAVTGIANAANGTTYSDSDWADPNGWGNYISSTSSDDQQTLTWSAFLDTIKNAVNWILGILATIALVVCLYGGFLMVTAAGDEKKYQKWLSVLKYAAIGLAIIGLSWMIVSVIFWFVRNLWETTASDRQQVVDKGTGGDTSTQWDKTSSNSTNPNGAPEDSSKPVEEAPAEQQ